MLTAAEYLEETYSHIRPRHVVELGADPSMELAAATGRGIPRISIVDFADCNEYKRGWWDLHKSNGINVERVDGDARELSKMIPQADLVYSHAVLYSSDGGKDIRKMLQANRGELVLSANDEFELEKRFADNEDLVVKQAASITPRGEVIWFCYDWMDKTFEEISCKQGRELITGRVIRMRGNDIKDMLRFYHLKAPQNKKASTEG